MKLFLLHAIEKDDFAYAIFEYASDCEKMINCSKLLFQSWRLVIFYFLTFFDILHKIFAVQSLVLIWGI